MFLSGRLTLSRLTMSRRIGPETVDLLDKLLVCNPRERLTASQALDHDYFWTDPLPADPKTWVSCPVSWFRGADLYPPNSTHMQAPHLRSISRVRQTWQTPPSSCSSTSSAWRRCSQIIASAGRNGDAWPPPSTSRSISKWAAPGGGPLRSPAASNSGAWNGTCGPWNARSSVLPS